MERFERVLITGGTGSFGEILTHHFLQSYQDIIVVIYSRNEYLQYEMRRKMPAQFLERVQFVIGDVCDRERVYSAMRGSDIVIHAAGLKHVRICEENPTEAVKVNVIGTQNVIDAAIFHNIKHVFHISTDKVANPVSAYGATKLCAEKLVLAAHTGYKDSATKFTILRFGNLMGSRGSVVYSFIEQAEKGVISLTHPEMTRFNLNAQQLKELVAIAIQTATGGQLYIPKLAAYRVFDLAKAVSTTAELQPVGLRSAEKLFEELLIESENAYARSYAKHFVLSRDGNFPSGGEQLPNGYKYVSNDPNIQMDVAALRQEIQPFLSAGIKHLTTC